MLLVRTNGRRVKLQKCGERKKQNPAKSVVTRDRQDDQLYFGEVPIVQMKKILFA